MIQNPRSCRSGVERCTPASVAEALYCACHHAPNGKSLKEIAAAMEWTPAHLTSAVDPLRADRPFCVTKFAAACNAAGTIDPVRVLASQVSCGIYLLPRLDNATTEINLRLLRVLRELGDVSEVLERIQADGRIDSDEGRSALAQMRELLEAVVSLQAAISEASHEAAPGPSSPARVAAPARATPARMTLPTPVAADRKGA